MYSVQVQVSACACDIASSSLVTQEYRTLCLCHGRAYCSKDSVCHICNILYRSYKYLFLHDYRLTHKNARFKQMGSVKSRRWFITAVTTRCKKGRYDQVEKV